MRMPDLDQLRATITLLVQMMLSGEQLAFFVVAALLVGVIIACLVSIWRNREPRTKIAVPAPIVGAASELTSALTRWLTPTGTAAVVEEPVAAAKPVRMSGKQPTMRVSTPVSRVPAKALNHTGADALSIARKSGLARDAVVMMLANAAPARGTPAAVKPKAPAPTVPSERAMSAPGAYAASDRRPPTRETGTRFDARLS